MQARLSKLIGKEVVLAGGGSSSAWSTTGVCAEVSGSGTKFFYKSAFGEAGREMLDAEFFGLSRMASIQGGIRVPTPIAAGDGLIVMEKLNLGGGGGGGDYKEMGRLLAVMHEADVGGEFGFEVDNTIGATPQPNVAMSESWGEFWRENRVMHMLNLAGGVGLTREAQEAVADKASRLVQAHDPKPSLLHGDLWGGNAGFADGEPVIYDPACYFGDREVDLAMTSCE